MCLRTRIIGRFLVFVLLYTALVDWACAEEPFHCEIPCPEYSDCVAQNKCSCRYGYKAVISDTDGRPVCRYVGTTTTPRDLHSTWSQRPSRPRDILPQPTTLSSSQNGAISSTSATDTTSNTGAYDEGFVDDNSELSGDYIHNTGLKKPLHKRRGSSYWEGDVSSTTPESTWAAATDSWVTSTTESEGKAVVFGSNRHYPPTDATTTTPPVEHSWPQRRIGPYAYIVLGLVCVTVAFVALLFVVFELKRS